MEYQAAMVRMLETISDQIITTMEGEQTTLENLIPVIRMEGSQIITATEVDQITLEDLVALIRVQGALLKMVETILEEMEVDQDQMVETISD